MIHGWMGRIFREVKPEAGDEDAIKYEPISYRH